MSVPDFGALRAYFGTTLLQRQYQYDTNGRLQYMGIAPRGVATSAAQWIVYTYTYDTNNALLTEKSAPMNSIFDNVLTLTYA